MSLEYRPLDPEPVKEKECAFCGEPSHNYYCSRGCETADSQERV